ncbi:CACTA en-spm transposon protein [Cucumis melo var. makuwa]|uniref:CACTA en-spm transposon protein n=1 Tax=Cucumis melo var. makuwa TaxID=1194695 RepID=A0A5D3CTJ0_CUCMM|nr:CACTA en-spm transposon protein [Cucumis melo var. makuwa]TYK14825.1 CACTA en-spm transposon protein [Cucumis melo var. makuwa]
MSRRSKKKRSPHRRIPLVPSPSLLLPLSLSYGLSPLHIEKQPYNLSNRSKSFLQRQHELAEQRGESVVRVELSWETHVRSRTFVSQAAEDAHNQMLKLQSQPTLDGSQPLSEDKISDQVLGRRPGYLKGLGWGPKLKARKTTSASSSSTSCGVRNDGIENYVLPTHRWHRKRIRREKVIPDALFMMRWELFSRHISSDDVLNIVFCVEKSYPDVFSTSTDVYVRRESPQFL